ncbi:MAG: ribonuclease PH [Clostridia bacterium]|nr:ribonuclease PH [Clostridia bacterium]
MTERNDGRAPDQLREHEIIPDFVPTAYGSCLIRTGNTRVICTASVEEGVPPFLRGKGEGWLTAEYAMLPASTGRRKARDGVKKDGRGVEISRLIGRALRQAVDRRWLGERTVTIDCDVLTADGGTRTAAITGGFVALALAVDRLIREGKLRESPIIHQIAAVSAGIVDGAPMLDLCYVEDSSAQTDMNFIMNEQGDFIELQGTGEGRVFTKNELSSLLTLGEKGCGDLLALQREALGERAKWIGQKHTLVLASNNAHKIGELKAMLGDTMRVISMREAGFADEIEETGTTFEENSRIKALAVARATGHAALADDSGLSVDALSGAPGVYSARYAGEHGNDKANNALLIRNLTGIEKPWTARFVCAITVTLPGGFSKTVRGECPGVIIEDARGTGGFGYDPHFLYEETGETFAQISAEDKNRVSHRSRAIQAILPTLRAL